MNDDHTEPRWQRKQIEAALWRYAVTAPHWGADVTKLAPSIPPVFRSRIKKLLNKYGAYSHMPVQNGMGLPTLDFVCCYGGLYLAIEAKAPGKKPTQRQRRAAKRHRRRTQAQLHSRLGSSH